MNTERLYELLEKLTSEATRVGVVQRLEQLISHISNQVNEPQNGDYQTGFSQTFDQLRIAIEGSWFVQLTPLETDVLEKIDLGILVGNRLPARIALLMRDRAMLPAVVRDELTKLNNEIKKNLESAKSTISSFQALGFDEGGLDPGVGELALKIPRSAISERFSSFIEDAQFLNDLVSVSVEIVEGRHDSLVLRSLASSDYGIFLEVVPQVVAFVVLTIERVMAGYKTVLEIRVLRDQLKERNSPDTAIKAIEEDLEKRIKDIARKGVEEALKEIKPKAPKARLNELETHAASLFRKLVERLDNGYDLDGRVGHLDDPPEDDAGKAEHANLVAIDKQVRRGIKSVRRQITESKNLKALEFKPKDDVEKPDSERSGAD